MSSRIKNGDAKPRRAANDPAQSKLFIEAARKAEAAETEKEADKAFKAVIAPKKSK